MSKFVDQNYLKTEQYKDDANLQARIAIHQRFSTNPQGWYSWVFDILEKLPQNARVLELGCGAGTLWATCPERIPTGWSLVLSDMSVGMLQSAWRSLVLIGHGFKFEIIDAQSIPYADASFDIVIANHMLYHVPDQARALAEIRRVLKPGGSLLAATNGIRHLQELTVWLGQASRDGHYQPFTLSFTLENGGQALAAFFEQVELRRYADSLRITEIDPLMAYIRSNLRAADLSEIELEKLRARLTAELRASGALAVAKESGLFLAARPA